jgi:hypothetical protein
MAPASVMLLIQISNGVATLDPGTWTITVAMG